MTSSEITGIVVENTVSYVETVFSLMERNVVVVPLRNVEDQYRIKAAGVKKIVELLPNERQWMKRQFFPLDSDDTALITFTSGTEGQPKGVKLTHNNLAEVIQRLNTVMQVDSSIREYIGIPVYLSFGIGRCRAVATAGGCCFIPAHGFNPFEIAKMLKEEQINAISAVPSLWRILLENKSVIGDYGKQVKWIEIGSQYMSKREKEELKQLFPDAKIVQHYGLTEASRTTLLEIHDTEGEKLESIGKVFGEIQVEILGSGQIAISGPHVASEYIIDGQTVNVKDDRGWLVTHDLGEIREGYLYYQGRADDVINCGGIKVSPEQLETRIFPLLKKNDQIAICRKPDLLRGDGFLVVVTNRLNVSKQELYHLIVAANKELGINATDAISIVEVDELPCTSSGKIQRKVLSEKFGDAEYFKPYSLEKSPSNNQDYIAPSTPEEKILCEICCEVLHVEKVSVTDDLFVLGIDSLLLLKLMFKLKSKGLKDDLMKEILSGSTIREIAAKISSDNEHPRSTGIAPKAAVVSEKTSTLERKDNRRNKYETILGITESINAVRGIAIILIVFNHWIEGLLNKLIDQPELVSLLRFPGTPIFVLAFGLFLSYLYFDAFQKGDFRRGLNIIYSRIDILLVAILLVGLPKYIKIFASGDFSTTAFAEATYSVMDYYLLAILTMPFLFYLIAKSNKWAIAIAITIGIISMSAAVYLQNFSSSFPWEEGWMLLIKLNLFAYYGYFNLLALTLLGVAIGLFLKEFQNNREKLYIMLIFGLISLIIGILLGGHIHTVQGFRILFPQMFFHLGIALLILVGMLKVNHIRGRAGSFFLLVRNILSTVGVMTLPIFILHGYVIPGENLLMYFGMSKWIALTISLFIFFLIMGWLAKTIQKTKVYIG